MEFKDLGISQELADVCDHIGWHTPTDIQRAVIPIILSGKDVIGHAETGSGKTGAFALPIIHDWMRNGKPAMFALVMCPARELCAQTESQFLQLGADFGLRTIVLMSGTDMADQVMTLGRWDVHVVVATPGRVVKMMAQSKHVRTLLNTIRHLVIDEADRMLELEFQESLEEIARVLPKRCSKTNQKKLEKGQLYCVRQTQFFSATMKDNIDRTAKSFLYKPEKIAVDSKSQIPKQLKQLCIKTEYIERMGYLFTVLRHHLARKIIPNQQINVDEGRKEIRSAVVFVQQCDYTTVIESFLNKMGASAVALHSQLSQSQREKRMEMFKTGEANILVATDVASRGLDIDHIKLVVNFDLPINVDWYKHRVGRTARAGRDGTAVTFYNNINEKEYRGMLKRLGYERMEEHPPVTMTQRDKIQIQQCIKEGKKERMANKEKRIGRDEDFSIISRNYTIKRHKRNE